MGPSARTSFVDRALDCGNMTATPDPIDRRERIVLPNRPILQFAHDARRDLEEVIGQLEGWMKRPFPPDSRPYAAMAVLRDMELTGRFTRQHRGDDNGVRAMQLAMDLRAIAECLPTNVAKDLREDLEMCASGPLDPQPDYLKPLQAQSHLIVRAAFNRANVPPGELRHYKHGGKKPDVLIENGLSTYGVEVKRPTKLSTVLPRAEYAAEQLSNANLKGGIVLDISDALTSDSPADMDAEVVRQAKTVMDAAFTNGEGWKRGYENVMMITVMARLPWQVVMTSDIDGEVNSYSTSCGVDLGKMEGMLDTIRARWMRDKLADGLDALGFRHPDAD
jgi:hypothetical protein